MSACGYSENLQSCETCTYSFHTHTLNKLSFDVIISALSLCDCAG